MEVLGIGMPELVFIIIIALLILGPKDMQKAGRTIGKFLRDLITSDGWKLFQQTSRDLRTLPNRLMREANEELNQVGRELNSAASFPNTKRVTPPSPHPQAQPYAATPEKQPGTETENKIAPEPQENKETDSESESQNNA